jgi:COP9 signalosome complex subunit 4
MASSGIASSLATLAKSERTEQSAGFERLLNQLLKSPASSKEQQAEDLVAFCDAATSSSLSIITVRTHLNTLIAALPSTGSEVQIRVGSHFVTVIQPKYATFEEQDSLIREILAGAYEAEEEYSSAAKTLQGIQVDSTARPISDVAKVTLWIRIVRYFLEDDDTVSAETALNKIKNSAIAPQVLQSSPDLQLHYQLSQARILDSRRDFLNASAEYYNVSQNSSVDEQDRLQALSASIKTAILAPAGPPRSRTLAKLYKDERSSDTEEYEILESMFLDRLLATKGVEAFAAKLAPHQLALTADGSTVLSKAVIEHNLVAASRLYENITTQSLAGLLGLKDGKGETAAEKAEDYAARMVEQGRLVARIDQIDGVITFESESTGGLHAPSRELRSWDAGVQGVVEDVERCAAAIRESFPVR